MRSDCKGQGLGKLLLEKMIRYALAKGIGALVGCTMQHNRPMLMLARACGIRTSTAAGADGVSLHLALHEENASVRTQG